MMNKEINSVDEYIGGYSNEVQAILLRIRLIIKQVAPDAVESISYGMPAYKLNKKPLVYFAAFQNHIGFYATPSGHEKFKKELSKYKQGKGSVQFPLNEPTPFDLIAAMVKFKVGEVLKAKSK